MKLHGKSSLFAKKAELKAVKAGLEIFAFDGSENGSEIEAADAAIGHLDEQIKKIDDDDRRDSTIFNMCAICILLGITTGIILVFAMDL